MRYIAAIFLLLIFPALTSNAQFNSSYILKIDDNKIIEGYKFTNSGKFTWFKTSGDNKELGEGTYTVLNKSIALEFRQALQHFDVQVSEREPNDQQMAIIEVRAIHSNGPALSNLKITLEKSNITQYTNSRGQATIEIKKPLTQDRINFNFPGFNTFSENITLEGISSLFGIVVDDTIKYREAQTLNASFKRSLFSMTINSTRFKKVRKGKFRKSYER